MKVFYKILALLAILSVLTLSGCTKNKQKVIEDSIKTSNNITTFVQREELQTYKNMQFNFSVDYPKNWSSEEEKTWAATEEHEGSPDGGINIFINSNKNEKIYIWGQSGHINIPEQGFEKEELRTNDDVYGSLLLRDENEKIEIHLILGDGFYGANATLSKNMYIQNKEEIINIFKSIKIIE